MLHGVEQASADELKLLVRDTIALLIVPVDGKLAARSDGEGGDDRAVAVQSAISCAKTQLGRLDSLENAAKVKLFEVKRLDLACRFDGGRAGEQVGLQAAGNGVGLGLGLQTSKHETAETSGSNLEAGEVQLLVFACGGQERNQGNGRNVIPLWTCLC